MSAAPVESPITADELAEAHGLLQRLRLAGRVAAAVLVVVAVGVGITWFVKQQARAACLAEVEALRAVIANGGVAPGGVVHAGREGTVIEAPQAFFLVQAGAVVAVTPRCPR